MIRLTKRQKFIFLSVGLTFFLWLAPSALPRLAFLPLSLALTFLTTLYALGFDLRFPEHLIFPIYPTLLVVAAWLHRPATSDFSFFIIIYIFSIFFTIYLLFLTLNILNIATVRTVPLKKAALSTFYFLGLIIGFFSIRGILALHPSSFLFAVFFLLLSCLLTVPLVYVIQPRPKLKIFEITIISLLSTEIALVTSFLKVSPIVLSIFLTAILFLLVDDLQHCVKRTLTKRILVEHIVVGIVFVAFLVISISFF